MLLTGHPVVIFLGTKYNTGIQAIPPENGPVHLECRIMRNVMASATEVELGGLFENFQESTYTRTALVEMVHQQPPTTVAKENTAAKKHRQWNSKKISGVIEIIFYWVRDRIQQNHLHIFWEEGKKNYLIMSQKHHLIWHHRKMRPRYVKSTKKHIENSKYRHTGT